MKKILPILVLLAVLIVLALPILSSAQPPTLPEKCTIRKDTGITGCPGRGAESIYDQQYGEVRGAVCCLMSSIYYVTDWMFTVLMVLSVLVGLFGAFQIITAGGDTERVSSGRNFVMFAVVGVAVALIARAIPSAAKVLMGV